MKRSFFLFISVFAAIVLISGCCTTRNYKYVNKVYTPVYKPLSELRSGVKFESAQDLKNPGKIYVFGKYIFIVEKGLGVHIIDNTNPASPQNLSFIAIPGNGDIAVKGNFLYADSYIDLVTIDISDPKSPKIGKRVEEIFPNSLDLNNSYLDASKGLLVDWQVKDTIIEYSYRDCGDNYATSPVYDNAGRGITSDGKSFNGSTNENSGNSTSGAGQTGKGGSMARFTLSNGYLYCVDRQSLISIDVTIPDNPRPWNKVNVGWNIETIFPYMDKLFIGSTTGMFIYDNSNGSNPVYMCEFRHARSCDPVVADEKFAYVTMRSGTTCAGNQNELDIVDIKNLRSPVLIKSYPMLEPAGVGVDGTTVFVCDGKAGLKVYDASVPTNLKLLKWYSDFVAYDIIPLGNSAIVIGENGLSQYDYTNPAEMKFLSLLPVKK